FRTNAGPAIYDVVHTPVLPAVNEPVVITARANDPNTVTQLVVRYRIDPSAAQISVPMLDNGTLGDKFAGDGIYSATIPGQPTGTRVAFMIQGTDGTGVSNVFPANAMFRVFPSDAVSHEALIRWG